MIRLVMVILCKRIGIFPQEVRFLYYSFKNERLSSFPEDHLLRVVTIVCIRKVLTFLRVRIRISISISISISITSIV